MGIFFNLNGKIYPDEQLVFSRDNRSFRFGDGLFETMKAIEGDLLLKSLHFERLFAGMKLLKFEILPFLTGAYLEQEVTALLNKNLHTNIARIRLTVFRGNGGLLRPQNHVPAFIIETTDITNRTSNHEEGLVVTIFPHIKKSCDSFSNVKSNNFLPYVMAQIHADENTADDCLLLNAHGRICESATANVFVMKDNLIYTPPLSEGCVAGVTRKWVLDNRQIFPYEISEKTISTEEIDSADEIFLTNAIHHMSGVKQFRSTHYKQQGVSIMKRILGENIS
ncbi:MAG: aminotransferase class IV [Ginsengibacter sp.]